MGIDKFQAASAAGGRPKSSQAPIQVRGLKKSYADFEAVKGIDFEVQAGEVFGLLGPNGAGKTTTVEILEGLRPRSEGEVRVLGFDPEKDSKALRNQIGVCLQSTNLPDKIRVVEVLELFASFYSRSLAPEGILKRLQLWDKGKAFYSTLSGGQKQRLALALALLNDPQVLFLDEPTSGLDPQARLEIHNLITELRREHRTVLLTTHYIEEAERLCDHVAIIDAGRIIEAGAPEEIQKRVRGQTVIEIRCACELPDTEIPSWPDADHVHVSDDRRVVSVASRHAARTLVEIVYWIDKLDIDLEDVHLKKPSLEDVFIELTGRSLRE